MEIRSITCIVGVASFLEDAVRGGVDEHRFDAVQIFVGVNDQRCIAKNLVKQSDRGVVEFGIVEDDGLCGRCSALYSTCWVAVMVSKTILLFFQFADILREREDSRV
ncbi:MAG: hypothetical protein MZU97_17365 [Bacillus subtilis]|nr:hypothetical protein [Bacillus subtilis]